MNKSEAMSRLKRSAHHARQQASARLRELTADDAVYQGLVRQRTALAMQTLAKKKTEQECAAATAGMMEINRRLTERQEELLQMRGLPADYLEPQYACARCQDTGTVDGRMCSCLSRLLMEGKPGGVDGETVFARYDETALPQGAQREKMAAIRDYLAAYAAHFAHGCENLFLQGAAGLGKSFLLGCTANAINERGYSVVYLPAYDMQEKFRQKHFGAEDAMDALLRADFLVLDDLGTESILKNITVEYLLAVLDRRQGRKLPTAVATNLTMEQLTQRYGERIVSRLLHNAKRVRLEGQDLRIYRAKR